MSIKKVRNGILSIATLSILTACGGGGDTVSASVPSGTTAITDSLATTNTDLPTSADTTILSLLVIVSDEANASFDGDVEAAVQHAVDYANTVHRFCQTGVEYNVSAIVTDTYNATVEPDMMQTVINTAPANNPAVADLREQIKADIVISVVQGDPLNDGMCGIAYVGQLNTNVQPNVFYDDYFAAAANIDPTLCGEITFAHELGHTVGLNHDEVQDGIDNEGAIEQYARGYGVPYDFVTIMAYPIDYHVRSAPESVFSTPELLCGQNELPCGVDKNDPHGADAVDIFRRYGSMLDVR